MAQPGFAASNGFDAQDDSASVLLTQLRCPPAGLYQCQTLKQASPRVAVTVPCVVSMHSGSQAWRLAIHRSHPIVNPRHIITALIDKRVGYIITHGGKAGRATIITAHARAKHLASRHSRGSHRAMRCIHAFRIPSVRGHFANIVRTPRLYPHHIITPRMDKRVGYSTHGEARLVAQLSSPPMPVSVPNIWQAVTRVAFTVPCVVSMHSSDPKPWRGLAIHRSHPSVYIRHIITPRIDKRVGYSTRMEARLVAQLSSPPMPVPNIWQAVTRVAVTAPCVVSMHSSSQAVAGVWQ